MAKRRRRKKRGRGPLTSWDAGDQVVNEGARPGVYIVRVGSGSYPLRVVRVEASPADGLADWAGTFEDQAAAERAGWRRVR